VIEHLRESIVIVVIVAALCVAIVHVIAVAVAVVDAIVWRRIFRGIIISVVP